MLWPKNSFGVVTWPCALAVAVAATKARGSIAARQVRNLRIDIQNLRKVGKARSELRLASGNTRQKRRLLSARQTPDTLYQLREIVRALDPRQHERPAFGDRHRVLEVRRQRAVERHDRPAIAERLRRRTAEVHHRLDRDREAGHELLAPLGLAVVRDLRFFMELDADAVPDEIAHDAEARGLDNGLHRGADVADVVAEHRRRDAGVERALRHGKQPAGVRADLTDGDGRRAVGEVAFVADADVDRDD